MLPILASAVCLQWSINILLVNWQVLAPYLQRVYQHVVTVLGKCWYAILKYQHAANFLASLYCHIEELSACY